MGLGGGAVLVSGTLGCVGVWAGLRVMVVFFTFSSNVLAAPALVILSGCVFVRLSLCYHMPALLQQLHQRLTWTYVCSSGMYVCNFAKYAVLSPYLEVAELCVFVSLEDILIYRYNSLTTIRHIPHTYLEPIHIPPTNLQLPSRTVDVLAQNHTPRSQVQTTRS